MSQANACTSQAYACMYCMHCPMTSQANADSYCMSSVVLILCQIYLYLHLLCPSVNELPLVSKTIINKDIYIYNQAHYELFSILSKRENNIWPGPGRSCVILCLWQFYKNFETWKVKFLLNSANFIFVPTCAQFYKILLCVIYTFEHQTRV